jgi:hypothetical protein
MSSATCARSSRNFCIVFWPTKQPDNVTKHQSCQRAILGPGDFRKRFPNIIILKLNLRLDTDTKLPWKATMEVAAVSHSCYECEVLKELYWLKVNQFLLATRSLGGPRLHGRRAREDEVWALKDEALGALSALISHWKRCYGLSEERAA